jgi:hypothetical protein
VNRSSALLCQKRQDPYKGVLTRLGGGSLTLNHARKRDARLAIGKLAVKHHAWFN